MEDKIKVELSNGSVVYVIEVWDCCNGCNDCGSKVEVYATKRCRKKDFLCEIQGTIPDSDDYLLDDEEEAIAYANAWNEFVTEIEDNINL